MCGRFTLATDPDLIKETFNLNSVPANIQARYNIAPTQPVAVITNQNHKALDFFTWGLIPSWSKDTSIGSKLINARSETAHEKPSFRAAFKRRRCLIPADGFYEWTKRDNKKVPMYVHLKDRKPFAFAGLWEIWQSKDGDEIRSCTILTTEPNDLIKPLHHRMAVILPEQDYDLWLSPDELPADALQPLLQAYPSEEMAVYEVSTQVNSPANDSPALIEPFESPRQQSLL